MSAAVQPDAFSRPTPEDRQRERARLQERLHPIVRELAARRGAEGITASDVIAEGIVRSVLISPPSASGERDPEPRRYSWIGPWLATLARHGVLAPKVVHLPDGGRVHVTRKSERHASHKNPNGVYLDPKMAA